MRARVLLLVSLLACACAQSGALAPTPVRSIAGEPDDIADLPARIDAPAGELALVADLASARGNEITLYLVNRTERTIEIPAQDGDPFARLEVQQGDGGWQRAQAHVYSSCGLSYQPIVLVPGSFVAVRQWYPSRGERATVRFALAADLSLASAAFAGRFDPAEREHARTDALAVKRADVALAAEILAGDLRADDWEQQSTRTGALVRLIDLPPRDAVPVLVELLDRERGDPNEYSRAIEALRQLDAARLAAYVRTRLAGAPSPQRARVVDELAFLPLLDDDALVADLVAFARDPRAPEAAGAIDWLAELRTDAIAAVLLAIADDARYSIELRQRARYDHAQWFGDEKVELRLNPRGAWSDGHPLPVWLDVDIVNSGDAPIAFDYGDPHELVELFLARSEGRDQTFLPPRPRAPAARAAKQHVALAPGETHRLAIAVADSFAIPPGDESLVVWATVQLPGIHETPQLAGGGAGIHPIATARR